MSRKYNNAARLKIVTMAVDTSLTYTGDHYGISRQAITQIFKTDGHRCLMNIASGQGKTYEEIQKLRRDELYKRVYSGEVLTKEGKITY